MMKGGDSQEQYLPGEGGGGLLNGMLYNYVELNDIFVWRF